MFVETYAGLAAVSLYLMGETPPASRIGAKTGYAAEIVSIARIEKETKFLLIDEDPLVCNLLRCLFGYELRLAMVAEMVSTINEPPDQLWRLARSLRSLPGSSGAAMFLIHMAGARGGIGGFKGRHLRRPNVDGFIPNRKSLVDRVKNWRAEGDVQIIQSRVEDVVPPMGAKVYMDPPYIGRQQYNNKSSTDVLSVARKWHEAGNEVFVSEAIPLDIPGAIHIDLTENKKGQKRRSLTTDDREWLTILR